MTDPAYGPIQASFTVQGGTPNQYQMQQGTAASKLENARLFDRVSGRGFTGGSAYPSSATTDVITFSAQFRRLT